MSTRQRYVAERFWPGATERTARGAMKQLRASAERLAATGVPVRYLGGTFVPDDEAIACRFEGTAQAVRAVHELAGVTFDRLLLALEVDGHCRRGLDHAPLTE
ncbi:MAG: hypothetical protein QOG85_2123 [Gaiellaceae bacterium]|jgi:hypothetical protein|nr:hypothetical protein [Gaiellaceae bacterium]